MRRRGGNSRLLRPLAAAAGGLCAAAPACAESGAGSPYGDIGQALVALVIFAAVLLILGKFAWKPVIAQLRRREQELAEMHRDAERRQREAKELEDQYRGRMDRAEVEARQVLAKTLDEAAKAREELLASARDEGTKAIEVAKAEIDQFKQAALEDLQQATAHLAVDIAGQLLREELTDEKQERLMEDSLDRIRRRVSGDGR